MNKIYTDNQIRAILKEIGHEEINVSEKFHNSIGETLNGLPEKKTGRGFNFKRSLVAASLAVAFVASVGIFNSAFAENIPFVGTVFKQISKNNAENTTHAKYAVGIGQTQVNKGMAITVDEAVFDGSRLAIGFTIKSDKPFAQITSTDIFIKRDIEVDFNGEKLKRASGETYGEFKGSDTFVGVIKLDYGFDSAILGDKAEVALNIVKLNLGGSSIEGNWKFAFLVDTSKTTSDTKVVKSDFSYIDEAGELKITRLVTSPLGMSIMFEAPQDPIHGGFEYNSKYYHFQAPSWNMTDNKGNKLIYQGLQTIGYVGVGGSYEKRSPGKLILKVSAPAPDAEYVIIKTKKFEAKIPLK